MLDARESVEVEPRLSAVPDLSRVRRILPYAMAFHDALSVYAAVVLAYWLRYGLQLGPVHDVVPFSAYQAFALLLAGIMAFTLLLKGSYRPRLGAEMETEFAAVVSAATISMTSIMVLTYMLHQFTYSRGVLVYLWILLILLVSLSRLLFRSFQGLMHRRGWGVRRVLIVGASESGKMVMQSVISRPHLGYEVIGFVDRRGWDRVPHFGRFQRLGTLDDIPALVKDHDVQEVVYALPGSAHEDAARIVGLCEQSGVGLKFVPDMHRLNVSRVQVDEIAGVPLLDVQEKPTRVAERALKRMLDLVAGSIIALLSAPMLVMLAVLIKLDSEGPIFVRQERVGKHGRRFTCFKLRTMRKDADYLVATLEGQNEAQGPIFKMRNDPRHTRVGRYIRKLSLDELPQIWNVVTGEMSLVGPRPPLPREVMKYEPWHMRRLETTPGMTGLWQVSGRSNLNFDEMVMMDVTYIDRWSLSLDLKILVKTFLAVVTARGAY